MEPGFDIPKEDFNAAVELVIAALGSGYYPARGPTLLDTEDWARLACATLAAVGRGYNHQYVPAEDVALSLARAEVSDPNPLTPNDVTLFHRLSAISEHLEREFRTDLLEVEEDLQDWFNGLRKVFDQKAAKAAHIEVDEASRQWKADQIDRWAAAEEAEISKAAKERNVDFFYRNAEEVGLRRTYKGQCEAAQLLLPTIGNKRTVSGSTPKAGPSTPKPTRVNPPRLPKAQHHPQVPQGAGHPRNPGASW